MRERGKDLEGWQTRRAASLSPIRHTLIIKPSKESHTVSNVPTEEHVTSARRIYEGKVVNLRVDTVVLPGGKTSEREIVEHRGAVALVPITPGGHVVLVRQWRTPAQAVLLEIPAGTLEEGEDPEACAHRELGEEVNFAAGRMTKMCEMYTAPGYSTELIHLYLAQELTPMQGTPDADEFLDIVTLSLSDAIDKIDTGEIRDAKSISGLLMAARALPARGAHGTENA